MALFRRTRLPRRPLRIAVLALLTFLAAWRVYGPLSRPAPVAFEQGTMAQVERVVDGDTLLLTSGQRVRLLGVDTPETKDPQRPVERFGLEASEFTRKHVE